VGVLPVLLDHFALGFQLRLPVFLHRLPLFSVCLPRSAGLRRVRIPRLRAGWDAAEAQHREEQEAGNSLHKVTVNPISQILQQRLCLPDSKVIFGSETKGHRRLPGRQPTFSFRFVNASPL
jgi:hypothetical protein